MIELNYNQGMVCAGYSQSQAEGKKSGCNRNVKTLWRAISDYFSCFAGELVAELFRLFVPSRQRGVTEAGASRLSRGLDYAMWTICGFLALGLVIEFYLLLLY